MVVAEKRSESMNTKSRKLTHIKTDLVSHANTIPSNRSRVQYLLT
jgi:hypothetical protein